MLKGAHKPGSAITSLTFSRGGFTLMSRSEDETLKVRKRARLLRRQRGAQRAWWWRHCG